MTTSTWYNQFGCFFRQCYIIQAETFASRIACLYISALIGLVNMLKYQIHIDGYNITDHNIQLYEPDSMVNLVLNPVGGLFSFVATTRQGPWRDGGVLASESNFQSDDRLFEASLVSALLS